VNCVCSIADVGATEARTVAAGPAAADRDRDLKSGCVGSVRTRRTRRSSSRDKSSPACEEKRRRKSEAKTSVGTSKDKKRGKSPRPKAREVHDSLLESESSFFFGETGLGAALKHEGQDSWGVRKAKQRRNAANKGIGNNDGHMGKPMWENNTAVSTFDERLNAIRAEKAERKQREKEARAQLKKQHKQEGSGSKATRTSDSSKYALTKGGSWRAPASGGRRVVLKNTRKPDVADSGSPTTPAAPASSSNPVLKPVRKAKKTKAEKAAAEAAAASAVRKKVAAATGALDLTEEEEQEQDWAQYCNDVIAKGLDEKAMDDEVFHRLSSNYNLDPRARPMMNMLFNIGFTEADFRKLVGKRERALVYSVSAARQKLHFLESVGIAHKDLRKILLKHPQILEYKIHSTMQPRMSFLSEAGVDWSDMGKVITLAPSVMELSVERTLAPRVAFLEEVVGVKDIGKVITKHPAILTYSTENTLEPRLQYLLDLGLTKDEIVKMVTRHPQILHYSEDGLQQRIDFLMDIGMSDGQIVKTITSMTQIFSLSVRENLAPKYDYYVNSMGGNNTALADNPCYWSLSTNQRIKPRHRFLLERDAINPDELFPMRNLRITDREYVERVAQCSLKEYLDYREGLISANFDPSFTLKDTTRCR